MTSFKILIFQVIALASFGQDSTREIRLSLIEWKLSVPIIASIRSSVRQDTIKEISTTYIKELVIIQKNKDYTCSIKVKPSEPDSLKAMSDTIAWNLSKQVIALTYTQKDSDAKFTNSMSSFEIIDGVRFDVFFYTIKPAKSKTFNVYILHAKHALHDIQIDISYDDLNLDLGNYFLDIIRHSTFGKL